MALGGGVHKGPSWPMQIIFCVSYFLPLVLYANVEFSSYNNTVMDINYICFFLSLGIIKLCRTVDVRLAYYLVDNIKKVV